MVKPSFEPTIILGTPSASSNTSFLLVVKLNAEFQLNLFVLIGEPLKVNSTPVLYILPTFLRIVLLLLFGKPTDGGSGTPKIKPSILFL
ncbi:hypothetical protein D9M68_841230 [compost metagenome]